LTATAERPEDTQRARESAPDLPPSFFRTVVETANEGIWMIDCEGVTTFANRRMEEMMRLGPGEMLGRHPADFLLPEDLELASAVIARTLGGESNEFEPRFRRGDGAIISTIAGTAPIRDDAGNIVGAVATFTDLTEHKRAEQALLDSEREATRTATLLNQLLESASDAIWMRDVDGIFRIANPAALKVMGAPERQVVGRSMYDVWGDEVGAHLAQEAKQLFANGEPISIEEEMHDAGRGAPTIFLSNKVPIFAADGVPIGILGVSRDITERKADEDALRESRAQLAQQVAELQAAQQREHLLAREVDHRAKNLLAVVQSVVLLTRAETAEELKDSLVGRIQALASAHALLAAARWDGVELSELIAEEMAPFTGSKLPRARFSGPALRLRPAAAQALAMVLHELATNAAKYGALSTHDGRVDIDWRVNGEPEELVLEWLERGCADVTAPSATGFGSRIVLSSIERQLRGRLSQEWPPTGLRCRIAVPIAHIATQPA